MPSMRRTLASLSSTTRILAFRISAELTMTFVLNLLALTDLLSRAFQCYVQSIHELIDLDWFGEIPEESCLQALLDVAWHCIRTQGNHGDGRRRLVCAQDFQGFDTTDARQ